MQTQAEKDKSRKTGTGHLGGEGPAQSQALAERDELATALDNAIEALRTLLDKPSGPAVRHARAMLPRLVGVLEAVQR